MNLSFQGCISHVIIVFWKFGHGFRVATWSDSNAVHYLTHLLLDSDWFKIDQRFHAKFNSKSSCISELHKSNNRMDQDIV